MRIDEPIYWIAEKVAPRKKIDSLTLNREISDAITKGRPFLAGKIGASELFAMRTVEFGYIWKRKEAFEQLRDWSGFFPLESGHEDRFVSIMKDAINCADILVNWNKRNQRYFVEKYGSDSLQCSEWISWSFGSGKWGGALDRKRVLVVHPFEESIKRQYMVFDKIHAGSENVPRFDLVTIKAIQSIGGLHDKDITSWESGLKMMEDQVNSKTFDVALVGCGAYGLPLVAYIKKMGKPAIHMGGDLQLMFGIMGNRWENNRGVRNRMNDYWIYPAESERPIGADEVENACYWGRQNK